MNSNIIFIIEKEIKRKWKEQKQKKKKLGMSLEGIKIKILISPGGRGPPNEP